MIILLSDLSQAGILVIHVVYIFRFNKSIFRIYRRFCSWNNGIHKDIYQCNSLSVS